MLVYNTAFGEINKVERAIQRIKAFEPDDGYYLAFSGGKDSQCVYHLAQMAGVKFEACYSVTTVDPPELMRFIKNKYPDVKWIYPTDKSGKKTSMWKILSEHTTPPTREIRYCCDILKENNGEGRIVLTGVRWAESSRRKECRGVVDVVTKSQKLILNAINNNPSAELTKKGRLIFMDDNEETRKFVDHCYQRRRTTVNPIIDWEEEDVWEFLNVVMGVEHCSLYDEGFSRIGCIGCPMQSTEGMERDFRRWPRYKQLYMRAFDEMVKNRPQWLSDELKSRGGYDENGRRIPQNADEVMQRFLGKWIDKDYKKKAAAKLAEEKAHNM